MKRSSFSKVADQLPIKIVTIRPNKKKTNPEIKKALNEGMFLSAMRALADFETAQSTLDSAYRERSLSRTVRALRRTEQEYSHARIEIRALPQCTEKDCMLIILEKADSQVSKIWEWAISRAERSDNPTRKRRR